MCRSRWAFCSRLGLSVAEALQGGRYAYFDAAVSLPFLLLIGRYLDHLLRRKARATAFDLAAMQTVTATRIGADGRTASVAARDIVPGDRLLLAAGDRAPVDVVVESGRKRSRRFSGDRGERAAAGQARRDIARRFGRAWPAADGEGDGARAGFARRRDGADA